MFRSSVMKFLNKYSFIQFIFVCLPVIMIMIYGYAYMTDMLGIAHSLEYNNSISERASDTGELLVVKHTERGDDGVVHAVVNRDFYDEVEVVVDDVIMYVQAYTDEWYQFVTASEKSIIQESCSLFDAELFDENKLRVTHDDISLDFECGDIICALSISDEGLWRVSFMVDDLPHYDLEELHMLELISSQGGRYTVGVTVGYEVAFDEADVNFCSNLPSNSLYYNESTGSFVRNVSKDYAFTFILRSNILIVFLSMILYYVLLYQFIVKEKETLDMIKNVYIQRVNGFAICLLPFAILITMMLL